MPKLAVFDFDSTLLAGETIALLAKKYGCTNTIRAANEAAISGTSDLFDSLQIYGKYLAGMSRADVLEVCNDLPLSPGAKDAVDSLKHLGYTVICFSGGFTLATEIVKAKIGLDATFANTLHFDADDRLTPLITGAMTTNESKGEYIQKIQSILGITRDDTISIGDGANDISMFKHAKLSFAYRSKNPKVNAAATYQINDLRDIAAWWKLH